MSRLDEVMGDTKRPVAYIHRILHKYSQKLNICVLKQAKKFALTHKIKLLKYNIPRFFGDIAQ